MAHGSDERNSFMDPCMVLMEKKMETTIRGYIGFTV